MNKFAKIFPLNFPLILAILLSVGSAKSFAQNSDKKGTVPPLKELFAQAKWDEVLRRTEKENGSLKPEEQGFQLLARAMALYQKKSWLQLAKVAANVKTKTSVWDDYADYYMAEAFYNLNRYRDAREAIDKIKKDRTNQKLFTDAQVLNAKVVLAEGRFTEAKLVLSKFEKSMRNQPEFPSILWEVARAEKGLKNQGGFCGRLMKLYKDYPDSDVVKNWGPFFDENKFESRETMCSFGWADLQSRIKSLLRAGLVDKAKKEVDAVVQRAQGQKTYEIDRIRAHFMVHEGEVNAAMDLMAPYFQDRQTDASYLNLMASAAARAGDSSTAIGTYQKIYKLSPGSKMGRQALFQAAFLSYQFQDYDGATRRFREFLGKHKGSGLSVDAEWHLSWISYLKNDYSKALEGFAALKSRLTRKRSSNRSQTVERIDYWTAMAHLKLKNYKEARPLFDEIAKSGSGDAYYSLAAKERLKQLNEPKLTEPEVPVKMVKTPPSSRWLAFVNQTPVQSPWKSMLTAFDNSRRWAKASPRTNEAEGETEETMTATTSLEGVPQVDDSESEEAVSEVVATIAEPEATEEDKSIPLSSSQDPRIVQRLERARQLIALDMQDYAKWELYEIERRTSNKDYLKALMTEYEKVGHFNRSSRIATDSFGAIRRSGGIEGQRNFWEKAYPKAHVQYVSEYSRKFGIPPEMVWAIMRAESSYKKDAISPVGALGLMQVMPKTGTKISELMGDKNFEPRSLLEPQMAIKVGTKYLSRMFKVFEGNRALVAASYNAGPHRVLLWLSRFGTLDEDEFIEHIPFVETRNYVKKVMANYQVYAHLYSNQKEVFPEVARPLNIKVKEPVPTKETWEDI